MRILLLCCLLVSSFTAPAQTGTRITGKVFTSYNFSIQRSARTQTASSRTVTTRQPVSDIKVMLIKVPSVTAQQTFFESNRQLFCQNNAEMLRKYPPKTTYTDRNGGYEFTGLSRDGQYILIFCDKKIQLSGIITGPKTGVTYTVSDKELFF